MEPSDFGRVLRLDTLYAWIIDGPEGEQILVQRHVLDVPEPLVSTHPDRYRRQAQDLAQLLHTEARLVSFGRLKVVARLAPRVIP